jgi:hypothetical protein
MRDSPKKLTAAPHEVSAHVMKPWRPPSDAGACAAGRGVLGYQWREYFYVGEERGSPRPNPCSIEPLEHERPPRQARTGREQQEEAQHHGNFDCNRAKRVAHDRVSLLRAESYVRVVFGPATFISETKATTQNICVTDAAIKDADRGLIAAVRRSRRFTFWSVEIEIRLHAAGKDVYISVSVDPKCPDQSTSSGGAGSDESAATTSAEGLIIVFESIAIEFGKPGCFAPFNPNALRRHMQEVGAGQSSRPF